MSTIIKEMISLNTGDGTSLTIDLENPVVAHILSVICLTAGPIAELFRFMGLEIKRKAEMEQSYVLRWLLKMHKVYGDRWEEEANNCCRVIQAMRRDKQRETTQG